MNYYNEIKQELINNEINRKVKNYSITKSDLDTYYNVGKMLSEAGKHYGERIIKEYIEGPSISVLVKKKLMKENYYSQIEEMAQMLKEQNLNIDYYPTNFIVQNDKLYYIDYECNSFMEQYSYHTWGRQYWY